MKDHISLISAIEANLQEAFTIEDQEKVVDHLTGLVIQIAESAVAAGDELYESPSEPVDKAIFNHFYHFEWAPQFRDFLLLMRDVVFQQMKGKVLLNDGRITEDELYHHTEQALLTLREAYLEMLDWAKKETARLKDQDANFKKYLTKWKLQQNPWPVYKKQIETIVEQSQYLREHLKKLLDSSDVFLEITSLADRTTEQCTQEMDNIQKLIGETLEWLMQVRDDKSEKLTPGKIVSRMEQGEERLLESHYLDEFTTDLEVAVSKLPDKLDAAVNTENGMILRQEIDLRKRTLQFIESETLPLIYEMWELTAAVRNGLKMTLANIRNRALLISNDANDPFEPPQLAQPLQQFRQSVQDSRDELTTLSGLMHRRLDKYFYLSKIFDTSQVFLPLSMQSTVRQLGIHKNRFLMTVREWISGGWTAIRKLWQRVEEEENLSLPEKTVRYLRSRTAAPDNHHYNAIFLTKGYVGVSFATGRQSELEHIGNIIDNWQQGFRGAVCLTGERFSGKSFFGELIASRYFQGNIIRLNPGGATNIEGRKMEATFCLNDVLEFVKKHGLNSQPLVWVDDLELWWDTNCPLNENVRSLQQFIDHFSTRCFVLVAMANWTYDHLQQLHDIGRSFQARLSMDNMPVQDVSKAILIRHGATHKKLVNKDGEELTPRHFGKMTGRIYSEAQGNIGEALSLWAASTSPLDEDHVVNDFTAQYEMPPCLNSENALLLSSILMQKRSNEYRLRKLFGQAFSDRYSQELRRLLGIGIVKRSTGGWLEIHEAAVNDVAKMLDRKEYV